MMLDLVLVAVVTFPALVGCALLVLGSPADRVAAPVAIVTATLLAVAAFIVSFPAGAADRPAVGTPFVAGAELGLAVDGLAALVLPTVATVSALVLIFSIGTPALRTARFHGLMLLFASAVLMTVLATSLPALLVSWEVMGATSYALIGYHWREPSTVSAGTTAFLVTRAADLGLYVAVGAAVAGGAGLGLASLADAGGRWRDVVAAGVLVAALGKAAQLPFSFWLSRAMHGPSPVSALLHSAAMVAMGGYLLLRVGPTLLASTGWAGDAAAWAGAVTAVALGLVAVAQTDLKQLLAASTAAQLGFVVLAAGVGATSGGAAHLVAHAAVKAGLFLAAGIWLQALGTKRLSALAGAAWRWPAVGACAVAGLLSLAGLPPLALWATKDAVLAAAAERSTALEVIGLVGAALAAIYATKALVVLLRPLPPDGEKTREDGREGTRDVSAASSLSLVPFAAGALVAGALALPPLASHVEDLVGDSDRGISASGLVISAIVSLVLAAATAVVMRRPPAAAWPAVLTNWLHLEPAAHRWVAAPTQDLARRLAHVDDTVLDRGVETTAGVAARLARGFAHLDDDVVDRAAERTAVGLRRLGSLARRPQTGQLHQYYLQALSALVLVLVVLVVLVLVR